ncbi:MAG: DUF4382 domain-containing protein [Acidobacteriota bacterium]
MRKTFSLATVPVATLALLLTGCGNTSNPSTTTPTPTPANSVPVSLTMTDDPPQGVDVLFFQVSLTDATLTPATGSSVTSPVSLLSNNTPIQIDVTQLQALSAFLSTASVPAGTYSSLSLTFANPQLVIFNQSDASLGSTCKVGTVCQLTPAIASATQSFSSSPFPVTVSSGSPLGLLIDFHLNKVVQQDLSVDLSVANGVSVKPLPSMPEHPEFGSVTGQVQTVTAAQNQFTMTTKWGHTFTVNTTTNTTFSNFPASACSAAGIACVAQGQILRVHVTDVASGGILDADRVSYLQASGTQSVEGTILGVQAPSTASGTYTVKMILHGNHEHDDSMPMGGLATVTIDNAATWAIDNNGFTIPSGLSFTSPANLTIGQNVQVAVEAGTLTSTKGGAAGGMWGPPAGVTFTTNAVQLEPTQLTAMITALDSANQSFSLGLNFSFIPWVASNVTATLFNVETTSQTTYSGFSTNSFSSLATNNFVSVNGFVFPAATSGNPPQLVAQKIVARENGWF